MSKFLILNDSHDRGKNSVHRKGDMHQDMMKKLDETIQLSKDCEFVIHLGDVWDSCNVSNSIIDDWLDRIEASKKTWYILQGNHDMNGASWKTSQNTALAHAFRRCSNLKILDEMDFPTAKIFIKGYPYYYGCEEDFKEKGIKHKKKDYFSIACTHAFISIKPFHPQVSHVQAKDIDTNYDLILCSHFHTKFDHTVNDTRYFNNGEWGRLSITEAKHDPQVAIFDMISKEIAPIKLESAKKGEEIFDLAKVEEVKNYDENMMKFIQSIESTTFQENSLKDNIKQIANEQKIHDNIVNLIINKIDEAERN